MDCTDIIGRLVVSLSNVRVKVVSQCYSVLSPIFPLFELLVHYHASGNTTVRCALTDTQLQGSSSACSLGFFSPWHLSYLSSLCSHLQISTLLSLASLMHNWEGEKWPREEKQSGSRVLELQVGGWFVNLGSKWKGAVAWYITSYCRRDIVCKGLWESSNRKKQVNERFHKSTLSYYWRMPCRCNANWEQECHREGNILYWCFCFMPIILM